MPTAKAQPKKSAPVVRKATKDTKPATSSLAAKVTTREAMRFGKK